MAKIIIIDGAKFLLPEGMSGKDVQALAGFLVTLTKIDYQYSYGMGESAYYAAEGAVISIGDQELVTKAEAKAFGDKAKSAYEVKQAAEKAALAA